MAFKWSKDYPGRFGLFAALPLRGQEGSLREIEHAFDVLKADGIALWTSYIDKGPGDPAFVPSFEELNRRKARVFFHPAAAACCRNLVSGLGLTGIIEYDLDTARAIESLLVNGTAARFPDIRFVCSHSGGALPVLAARIIDDFPKDFADCAPHGVEHELKQFHYEVAHASRPPALDALKDLVPLTRILFASDGTIRPYGLTINALEHYGRFSAKEMQAINRGNAERLFPRLQA